MPRMVSYHRPKSGHITCYLNRTYHVLPTQIADLLCRVQKKRILCQLQSQLKIPVAVRAGGFENAGSVHGLSDCSGCGSDFLSACVCPERSASAPGVIQGSESNCNLR